MLDAVTQSKDLISMAEDRCREAEVSQFSLHECVHQLMQFIHYSFVLFSLLTLADWESPRSLSRRNCPYPRGVAVVLFSIPFFARLR